MEIFYNAIAFLGGLSMFLYGMRVMGDGLKSSSGGAMKTALAKVTNKPVMGFLLGMLVACIIQSSTATIVITVGLVGAGFLTFHQSVGIVLGANVGTAITAQIIRLMDVSSGMDSPLYFFKADNLAPLALVIGIVCIMFLKSGTYKTVGSVACGFGILFMGLIYMSNVVSGFGESLSHLLTAFSNNYDRLLQQLRTRIPLGCTCNGCSAEFIRCSRYHTVYCKLGRSHIQCGIRGNHRCQYR